MHNRRSGAEQTLPTTRPHTALCQWPIGKEEAAERRWEWRWWGGVYSTNPSSCTFPTWPKSLLTPHEVNLHFGDLVPPFPDQADVSRSLRGWWWWGLGTSAGRKETMAPLVRHRWCWWGRTVSTNESAHRRLRAIIVTVSRVDNKRLG